MSPQFMLQVMQIIPGLTQLFTSVILPVAGQLLKFTIPRITRLPLYLRLLWTIYSDCEPNSEARRYLTSVLVLLGSILTFMAWSYIPLTGVPIIGAFTTPVASMVAIVVSLVSLEFIFGLNQEYTKKYPHEFEIVKLDIEVFSSALGKSWEEIIEQTQALLNTIKQQLDPNGNYDNSISASINALNSYLKIPQNSKSLPPDEIRHRLITEGLPPLAKVGGSIVEGIIAGSVVGNTFQSVATGMLVKAGFWTSVKATFGLTSGVIVSPAVYGLLTVAAPIGLAAVTGLGVGHGATVLRNEGEKHKSSQFMADILEAALPMAWIDGSFSIDERDMLETLMFNPAISETDKRRVRKAIEERRSFEDILHSGLLKEKNPQKAKIKYCLLLGTAYDIAKADGVICENEIKLHNQMAKFVGFREEEVREIRRLVLLKSGIDIRDRIKIIRGNIFDQSVDAIVNSANKTLLPGSKLGWLFLPKNNRKIDTTIHSMAGPLLRKECREMGNCDVGQVKMTQGYNLSSQWVIHTVTPIWIDGSWEEQKLLRQCYRSSLVSAHQHSIRSIAFPALGTRTGRVPIDQSAKIAISEVQQFLNTHFNVEQVILVCWDEQTYEEYMKVAEETIGVLDTTELLEVEMIGSSTLHEIESDSGWSQGSFGATG